MAISALAVSLAVPREAVAGESLTWAAPDFPPFEIIEGPYSGTGSFDGLLEQLIIKMGEYDHQIVPMSFARRDEEQRNNSQFCTPGIFATPSRVAQDWVFSLPALIHLDNRVVMLADTASRVGGLSRPVDIDALFQRKDLIGGVVASRSFAANIDAAISRHRDSPNLLVRALRSEQFFQMLLARQIDYVILFPHEAAYLAKRYGGGQRIVAHQIAGTSPYIFTYVACSGGPWAQRMVGRINQALLALRADPGYRLLSARWYDDEDKVLIERYLPKLLDKE